MMKIPKPFFHEVKNISILLFGILCIFLFSQCQKKTGENPFDRGKELYFKNRLKEALPYLKKGVKHFPETPDCHAYLAETYRRLNEKEKAIHQARKALLLNPCHSFAHTVLAHTYNPLLGEWQQANSDSTWSHLLKAVQCDSSNGNAWTRVWIESIRRNRKDLQKKAVHKFIQSGFLTPSLLAYARWVLNDLPKNAILCTNGDMDTYPVVALQETEGFRPDVAVVNLSLLNTTWYARYIRDHYSIPLPFEDDKLNNLKSHIDQNGKEISVSMQIVQGWMDKQKKGDFKNPITFAATVNLQNLPTTENHRTYAGSFLIWHSKTQEKQYDTPLIRKGLNRLRFDHFTGSLVSPQDLSPIRVVQTNHILRNISHAALFDANLLIQSGKFTEAQKRLDWLKQFEENTVLGSISGSDIKKLEDVILNMKSATDT